jgi:hypothetical protein
MQQLTLRESRYVRRTTGPARNVKKQGTSRAGATFSCRRTRPVLPRCGHVTRSQIKLRRRSSEGTGTPVFSQLTHEYIRALATGRDAPGELRRSLRPGAATDTLKHKHEVLTLCECVG